MMHNSLALQQVLNFFGAAYMRVNCFQYQFRGSLEVVMGMTVK